MYPRGPKSGLQTTSEINVQNDITLKGVSLIWKGPIAYLVFLTISINFHKPMSVPYMFSIAGVFAVAHVIKKLDRS